MARDTNEELLQDLVKTHQKTEKEALTQDEYDEIGEYNSWQFVNRFGGWNEAKKKVGVPRVNPADRREKKKGADPKISEEKLKEELRKDKTLTEIAEEYGYSSLNPLSQRISRYDWSVKNKLSKPSDPENTSRILSLTKSDIEEAGFEADEELYYEKKPKDGKIVIDIGKDRIGD